MTRLTHAAALAVSCAALWPATHAHAHAIAGARIFPVTLTIDDPGVSDEASIPTFTLQRAAADGGPGATYQYNFGAEYDKRITQNLGIGVSDAFVVNQTEHDKTRTGFQDITVNLKYQTFIDGPHEAIVSLGVIREFGRTGTAHVDADQYGSTTPTVYFGKGFGDLPVAWLRPFAITGTAGFAIADKELKAVGGAPASAPGGIATSMLGGVTGLGNQTFNNGYANRWTGGLSLQYSLPYLTSQVKDLGLPDVLNRLIPLVEVAYSSPASKPSNLGTQVVFAPGVLYEGESFQLGIEALIPANRASGRNIGVIGQVHLFFDDLFPNTLGKPIWD